MAWTYNDWVTKPTYTERESQLRLHLVEVSNKIDADVAKGGSSRATSRLMDYYDRMMNDLEKLEKVNARASSPRSSHANFNGS